MNQLLRTDDTVDPSKLSLAEQLRRERMRLFTSGISSYEWSRSSVTIPMNGDIYHFTLESIEGEKVIGTMNKVYDSTTNNNEASIDPHPSPDGTHVAFVLDRDLYIASTKPTSSEVNGKCVLHRITTNGINPGISCGLADFVAQEEMDRYRGKF